jgi:hypothetical protein
MDASIRINVVALAAGLALTLARIRCSSVRHRAWLVVLCAMLSMPILPHVTPRIDLPVIDIPIPSGAGTDASLAAPGGTRLGNAGPGDTGPGDRDASADLSPIPVAAGSADPERVETHIAAWPAILFGVYATGVTAFLCQLLAGWLMARRVLGASRGISVQDTPVYESAQVSTPMTIGLRAPKILLPMDWSKWPADKVRAVLAHELTHAERRDTITSFAAHLNRCLFWFHPLAWWLQRQLTLTAEQACDDAGVRAMGEIRKYAEILLDMAETVRRRGSRLVCQGMGAGGTGLLGSRIDRILRGAPVYSASRAQKAVAGLSCAAAVFVAAACRERSIYSVELKPDHQNSAILAKQKTGQDFNRAAWNMDARQVEDLEAAVRRNPEDLETRKKLMIFYQASGRKVLGDQKTVTAFWAHRLWCIQHHPDDICASLVEPLSDPAAYHDAKKLWLAVVRRKDVEPGVFIPAAMFIEKTDQQLAERIALRAPITDARRTSLLGLIYASALAGAASQSPYGQEVRKKLEGSTDSALLAETGVDLAILRGESANDSSAAVLGRSYLDRAVALDANSAEARDGIARVQQHDFYGQFYKRMYQAVGQEASEAQYQKAASLPPNERFEFLPYLAENAYIRGEMLDYYRHDRAAAGKDWELAQRYAREALRLAPGFGSDTTYDDCFYKANMTLGMVAMRVDGDKKAARKYLLAASTAHTTENSAAPFIFKLPVLLLKYGGPDERKAVIEFLERYGKSLHRKDLDLLLAAKQLRQGVMPIWYQYQPAQLQ